MELMNIPLLKERYEQIERYYNMIGVVYDDEMIRKEIERELDLYGMNGEGNFNVWIDQTNTYKFEMARYDNEVPFLSNANYINTITIYNNIGIKITEIRFNEFDCIRILSKIVEFTTYYYNTGDSYAISINPNNTGLTTYVIYIQNIFEEEYDDDSTKYNVDGNLNHENWKDVLFQIVEYNPQLGVKPTNLVTLKLQYEELQDLAFQIFFHFLIDLDLSQYQNVQQDLRNIEHFMVYGQEYDFEYTGIENESNGFVEIREKGPVQLYDSRREEISQNQCNYTGNFSNRPIEPVRTKKMFFKQGRRN